MSTQRLPHRLQTSAVGETKRRERPRQKWMKEVESDGKKARNLSLEGKRKKQDAVEENNESSYEPSSLLVLFISLMLLHVKRCLILMILK